MNSIRNTEPLHTSSRALILGKLITACALIAYIATFVNAGWYGIYYPHRNPDMLAYVAAVISLDTKDPQQIYDRTLQEVKKAVPADEYKHLSQEIPVFSNSDALYRWLPVDLCKPLYVRAVWLLHQLGAGLAQATWLTSNISFAIVGVLCALWRPRNAPYALWLLAVIILCRLDEMPLVWLARYSTPDALALMLFLLSFIGWVRWQSALAFAAGGLFSILTRPDMLPLIAMSAVYFAVFPQNGRRMTPIMTGLVIVAGAGICFGIQTFVKGSDLASVLYRGAISNTDDISHGPPHITWAQYYPIMVQTIRNSHQSLCLWSLAAISPIALLASCWRPTAGQWQWFWLLLMTWAALVARFLPFPSWEPRYYYGYYLLMSMACLELLYPVAVRLLNSAKCVIGRQYAPSA